MSAKSLIRYRSEVGAADPLSGQQWQGGHHDNQGKKSPTGSLGSDGASVESSSPESGGRILEEDSFDEGIDDILAQNPSCNLCGHNFYNTADFLSHVRMHFSGGGGGGKKGEEGDRKRKAEGDHPAPGKSQRTSPLPGRRQDEGSRDQVVDYSAQQSPREVEESFHRQPTQQPTQQKSYQPPQSQAGTPTPPQPTPDQVASDNALFDLLNSPYNHQPQNAQLPPAFGFNLNFPSNPFLHAPTIPQLPIQMSSPFHHPNLPTYSPHPLLNPVPAVPTHTFKCFACPASFDKREAFLYHLNFHSSYLDASESAKQGIPPNMAPFFPNFPQPTENNFQYNPNTNRRPKQSYSSTPSPNSSPYPSPPNTRVPDCTQSPRCTCNNCTTNRQNKKMKKQVEDIDPEQLKKIQALEWEKKHG